MEENQKQEEENASANNQQPAGSPESVSQTVPQPVSTGETATPAESITEQSAVEQTSQSVSPTQSAEVPVQPAGFQSVAEITSAPAAEPVTQPVASSVEATVIASDPISTPVSSETQSAEPVKSETEPKTEEKPAEKLESDMPQNNESGSIWRKLVTLIIIIVIAYLMVQFFSGEKQAPSLSGVANVNIKVSNEQEQGQVNIVFEDNKKLNNVVSATATNQATISPVSTNTVKIVAFYGNSQKNPNAIDCGKVFPLERNAEKKYDSAMVNTVRWLLTTLTEEEKAQGFYSTIPAGTMLKTIKIGPGGVAEVNFTASLGKIAGSCAVASARAQITATVKQFSGVNSVKICVDGNCNQDQILQP